MWSGDAFLCVPRRDISEKFFLKQPSLFWRACEAHVPTSSFSWLDVTKAFYTGVELHRMRRVTMFKNLTELICLKDLLTFNFLWCKESIKVVCSQSQWHIGQDATVHEGPAEAVDGHAEQEDGVVGRPQRRRDPHLDVPLKKFDIGLTDVSTDQSNDDYVKMLSNQADFNLFDAECVTDRFSLSLRTIRSEGIFLSF